MRKAENLAGCEKKRATRELTSKLAGDSMSIGGPEDRDADGGLSLAQQVTALKPSQDAL